mgnify:CR=1 FL=1
MDILISYDNQELSLSLAGGESAALYGVPAEYSEDGLYLAQWGAGELEPLPACGTWTPLLRLRLVSGEDGADSLVEDFKSDGVSYAQN